MRTVRFCGKFHSMIYCINYSHVGFMLLSLKMQPHSKVDLKYSLAKTKVLLIVINGVQYLLSCSFAFGMLNFFFDLKLSLRFEKLHLVFIHSCHLVSFLPFCVLVVIECCISFIYEACLNFLLLSKRGLAQSCPLAGRTDRKAC